jgi:23S rRNA (guanosine2251-2'-O)-methyltransferase
MVKLNAQQLRKSSPTKTDVKRVKRNPVFLVLDRIIDTYNIGSLFRLADAIASEKLYLCGDMEYPPNSRIKKAAIGTDKWVPWKKTDSTLETVRLLKKKGVQIIVVEQSEESISYKNLKPNFPCAIVVGNESFGMDKKIVKEADIIVELPMYGINKSFNVWGSAAVIAYKVLEEISS